MTNLNLLVLISAFICCQVKIIATNSGAYIKYERAYIGCFDNEENTDDPLTLSNLNIDEVTVPRCLEFCRINGYEYAGLQSGSLCYCGSSFNTFRNTSYSCSHNCQNGDQEFLKCGGYDSMSIYKVQKVENYIGCYRFENKYLLWKSETGGGKKCIKDCRLNGYEYALLNDGGNCFCSEDVDIEEVHERHCQVPCKNSAHGMNCGGQETFAAYGTGKAVTLSGGVGQCVQLDHNTETVNHLHTGKNDHYTLCKETFDSAPLLKNWVSDKFVLHSAEPMVKRAEGNDYEEAEESVSKCDNTYIFNSVKQGKEVVIRQFSIRLSELDELIDPSVTEKVFIYAQVILFDKFQFPFLLQVYARQIYMENFFKSIITVSPDRFEIDDDTYQFGPESDFEFALQSFECASMLVQSKYKYERMVGRQILFDIGQSRSTNKMFQSISQMSSTFYLESIGIEREGILTVPLFSMERISTELSIYYDSLSVLNEKALKIEESQSSSRELLYLAEEINNLYQMSIQNNAEIEYEQALATVERSNTVYKNLAEKFNAARTSMDTAREKFVNSLLVSKVIMIVKCVLNFGIGIGQVIEGIVTEDPKPIATGFAAIMDGAASIDTTMDNLKKLVNAIEKFDRFTAENQALLSDTDTIYDGSEYIYDLDQVISMKKQIVEWQNLKIFADIMLMHKMVVEFSGCTDFLAAINDCSNWGQALSLATVERAESMRVLMTKRHQLDFIKQNQLDIQSTMDSMRHGVDDRKNLLTMLSYDIYSSRMEADILLYSFCSAYMFERLEHCNDCYHASFGTPLSTILLKISAAMRDSLTFDQFPSTTKRKLSMKDENTALDCNDMKQCPLKYFKENGYMMFTIDIDNSDLIDLKNYRVMEICLNFKGAKVTSDNQFLQVRIEASGECLAKNGDDIFKFLHPPLKRNFEYNVETGFITIHADIHTSQSSSYSNITPYTQWIITLVKDRSEGIDFSAVEEIELQLIGSASIRAKNSINFLKPEETKLINVYYD